MPTSRLRRRAGLGFAVATAALAITACMPADGVSQTVALAGSDTTQDVSDALAAEYNADRSWNSDPDRVENVLAQEPFGQAVKGDDHCANRTYWTPANTAAGEFLAPNGSGAGRDALRTSVQNGDGCIDVARSSSPPRAIGQDLASFHYVAFGLDAVGWSSGSSRAPQNLTLAQIRGIYNCTFTNWNQVGGTAGPIQRYWPQDNSGTMAFFRSDVLAGFNPLTVSSPTCPAPIRTQENTGEEIAANGDIETAVVPYSAANFVAQSRGTQEDQRAGQVVRSLNGQALVTGSGATALLNTSGPVQETNVTLNNPTPAYPGIRYVYYVLDDTSVSYNAANRLFGFVNQDNGGKSPLCSGRKVETIQNYGFGALDATTNIGGNNLAGATCREYRP